MQSSSRLLLSCALEPVLVDATVVRTLASQVEDWAGFVAQAEDQLALPLVVRRLQALGVALPTAQQAELECKVRDGTAQNLRLAGTLTQLHRSWLAPRGVRYAAVKGIAVASRYYGGLAGRSCRDLDLLIERTAFASTVAHLCSAGFRLCHPFELPADPLQHARHIEAVCDLNREISLRSPANELIDVHHNLDLTGADMPTERLLGRAERVSILGEAIPVLSTADLFVYVCYHHSRHHWTKLHWVADMGRIAAAPEFDRAQVLATARRSGMEKLIVACLEMPALLAGAVRGEPLPAGLGGRMASECLDYLQPGAVPLHIVYHQHRTDRRFRWVQWFEMTALEWRQRQGLCRKLRAVGRSLMPSWQMYRDMPLPKPMRWLYVPLRFVAHLLRYTPLPVLRAPASHRAADIASDAASNAEKDAG